MEIDVVAPGVKLVTHGLNEIITEFHSTSGATPHVTGVAALMLSVNNDIKGEAVRNIIRRTAQRGSDPNHDYDTNSWFSSTGPRNNYMGHGVIDATECVKIAGNFETGEDILDLHMRNSFNDYGVEPDNVTRHANYVLWDSPDIWVRKQLSYPLCI